MSPLQQDLVILETEHTRISQAKGIRIPGYLIVEPRSACTQISDLDPEQAADLMHCLSLGEALVQELTDPGRIYILKFGEEVPQIHFHIVPRTQEIARAYGAESGDSEPFNGARIVDWIWMNQDAFGITDDQLRLAAEEARAILHRADVDPA